MAVKRPRKTELDDAAPVLANDVTIHGYPPVSDERAEQWKSRALYEEDEKLRMEQRIADLLWQTGRWHVRKLQMPVGRRKRPEDE